MKGAKETPSGKLRGSGRRPSTRLRYSEWLEGRAGVEYFLDVLLRFLGALGVYRCSVLIIFVDLVRGWKGSIVPRTDAIIVRLEIMRTLATLDGSKGTT